MGIFSRFLAGESVVLHWWWDDPQGALGPGYHRRFGRRIFVWMVGKIPPEKRVAMKEWWKRARTPLDWTEERPTKKEQVVEYLVLTKPEELYDRFGRWWKKATAPLDYDPAIEPLSSCLKRRVRIWAPVITVLVIFSLGLGLYSYVGWRARSFAARALESMEQGNWQLARLQAASAYILRSRDPQVLLTRAKLESFARSPYSPEAWDALPSGVFLTHEEIRQRAEAMSHFGSTDQHRTAIDQLDRVGLVADAAGLRAEKLLSHGNFGNAIVEARKAVLQDGSPEHKLTLVRLLLARYTPSKTASAQMTPIQFAAVEEATGLIDSLLETPLREDALALGLSKLPVSGEKVQEWVVEAWQNPEASNPALLPAAVVRVKFGEMTAEEMKNILSPIYKSAPLKGRVAFASWMLSNGWPQRALAVVSAKEAVHDAGAFILRADAFAAIKRWPMMLVMADEATNASESLKAITRAVAAKNVGRPGEGKLAVQETIQAALRDGKLLECLRSVDSMGDGDIANEVLIKACSQPGLVKKVFPILRDRLMRSGKFYSMDQAYSRASAQSSELLAVKNYSDYLNLLAGRPVEIEELAEAVEKEPGSTDYRMTYALALLLAGKAEYARMVFDDIDIFVSSLPPAYKAIASAVFLGSGDPHSARAALKGLNPDLLTRDEYLFLVRNTMSLRSGKEISE